MERKNFIKKVAFAALSFSLLESCRQAAATIYSVTPEGEEGPFPTHLPASFTSQNIILDRAGTPLKINIFVHNINQKCEALAGAQIDIWHCDSAGNYSEYGGNTSAPPNGINKKEPPHGPPPGNFKDSLHHGPPPGGGGMQKTDYTGKHFLRGRQITNADGLVTFDSIYPGWYAGRATHIHAHIFDEKGQSLLITQIAFPEDVSRKVHTSGVYAKHGLADTSNQNDHVFKGNLPIELAVITGNLQDGYTLTHNIYVKG